MSKFSALLKTVGRVISDHSPQIMTGMAVAGVVTTTVLAVKVTPEATYKIEHYEINEHRSATPIEKVKVAGPLYIPALISGSITIACVISGHSISTKRNAAIMGLYSLTETSFREYREKMIETIGTNKEKAARDDIAKDRVEANPLSSNEVIIIGKGDVLCYDTLTGRYFQSDVELIRRAQNDINQKIINENYGSQNDLYRLIGLPIIKYGDDFGWSTDMLLDIDFTTVMSKDNRPCISINYRMAPIRGYYNSFL